MSADKKLINLHKKMEPLGKDWVSCLKKSKCQSFKKKIEIEKPKYDKQLNKLCGTKKGAAYNNCNYKFDMSSKLTKLYNQYKICAYSVCIKEKARMDKIMQEIDIIMNDRYNKAMEKLNGNKKR